MLNKSFGIYLISMSMYKLKTEMDSVECSSLNKTIYKEVIKKMLKKYSVEKPSEIRLKILEFCTKFCEFHQGCFSLPLSNCCIKNEQIEEWINK